MEKIYHSDQEGPWNNNLVVHLNEHGLVVLNLWFNWEIFNILEYFTGTTCLMICYITVIDKRMDNL